MKNELNQPLQGIRGRDDEVLAIQIEGWCSGLEDFPGEIHSGLLHRVVKELQPAFRAAFEKSVIFDIPEVAKRISMASDFEITEREAATSICAQFPSPVDLSRHGAYCLLRVLDRVVSAFPDMNLASRLRRKWRWERERRLQSEGEADAQQRGNRESPVDGTEWYSVFISYDLADIEFCRGLRLDLESRGMRVFLEECVLGAGESLPKRISDVMNQVTFVVVVLSPDSVKSKSVRAEIDFAKTLGESGKPIKTLYVLRRLCEAPKEMGSDLLAADFREDAGYYHSLNTLVETITGDPEYCVRDRYNEVFAIEVEGWRHGLRNFPGEITAGLVHRTIKELQPAWRGAIENGHVFSLALVADQIAKASNHVVTAHDITFSILAHLPAPEHLSDDEKRTLKRIVDQAEQQYGGAWSRLTRKWRWEREKLIENAQEKSQKNAQEKAAHQPQPREPNSSAEDRYDKIFAVEIEGWCYGVKNHPGTTNPQLVYRVVEELAPVFRAAIQHGHVFSLEFVAEQIAQASNHVVASKDIVCSILSQLPAPEHLPEDEQRTLQCIVDQVEQRFSRVQPPAELPTLSLHRSNDVLESASPDSARPRSGAAGPQRVVAPTEGITNTSKWKKEQVKDAIQNIRSRLGFDAASENAKKWWQGFEEENQHRLALVLRVGEELLRRELNIEQYFLAFIYANTSNIAADLAFADYHRFRGQRRISPVHKKTRRLDATSYAAIIQRFFRREKRLAAALCNVSESLMQQISIGMTVDFLGAAEQLSRASFDRLSAKTALVNLLAWLPPIEHGDAATRNRLGRSFEQIETEFPRASALLEVGPLQLSPVDRIASRPIPPLSVNMLPTEKTFDQRREQALGERRGSRPAMDDLWLHYGFTPPQVPQSNQWSVARLVSTCSFCGGFQPVFESARLGVLGAKVCCQCLAAASEKSIGVMVNECAYVCTFCGREIASPEQPALANELHAICGNCHARLQWRRNLAPGPPKNPKNDPSGEEGRQHPILAAATHRGPPPVVLKSGLTNTIGLSVAELLELLEQAKSNMQWASAGVQAQNWWRAFETDNCGHLQLVVRVAEEVAAREFTLDDLYEAYLRANTDNIQAVLFYMDYYRVLLQHQYNEFLSACRSAIGETTKEVEDRLEALAREYSDGREV